MFCVTGADMELCEAETVAVLCGAEIFGVQRHFAGSKLPPCLPACLPPSRSDKILVTKYNVHANRLIQCFSSTTFNHQES